MDLLEREASLHELDGALQEAAAGNGRVVLVSGEAGIGKTSLIEKFVHEQKALARVLWGVCDAMFTPRPLGPLHDMAGQTAGELPHLLNSDANRPAIFSAILNELTKQPTVAVFEDVHWADEGTLDTLRFLGRRITRTSALLILTYRDDALNLQHPLRIVLGDLATSTVTRRMALQPLTESAVHQLVGQQTIDVTALHRQTGGNPFFVTEVLASREEVLPPTIRDAVLARAARMSLSAQAVLQAAAVIGSRIEPWLLADVTGAEAQAADECLTSGMLHVQGDALAFRHELAQQAILEVIPPQKRIVLNKLVLEALMVSPLGRNDLARLAHHAEAAHDHEAILEYAPAAARQAAASGAHRAAAALYTLAAQHADDLSPGERAQLLGALAVECDATAQRPKAIAARRQAADLWLQAGELFKYGRDLSHLALLLHLVGEKEEANQVNTIAVEVLEDLPPNRELVLAYNTLALLYLANLENAQGVDMAQKAIALAERMADHPRLPRLYETLGLCWLHLDYARGCEYLERSHNMALEIGQTMRAANSYSNLSSAYVEFYQFNQAEQFLAEGLNYAAERELEFARSFMLAWRAQLHQLRGRWNEALEDIREVVDVPGTAIGSRGTALMVLGSLRARRGEPDADTALDESLELLLRLGYRQREALVRAARAEAAWLAGDRQRTMEEALAVYEIAIAQRHPWMTGELAFWRWRAGDMVMLPEWTAEPFALQITGDWQEAATAWERLGCPYEQARALADGDVGAQMAALALFEQLGARPMAEIVRQKLRDAGVQAVPRGPRTTTKENPFGLTNRQVEVLTLLTENLTNAQIAARLHISPKTVDHHVSAVLGKLDVSSREEAAETARQHPDF